MVNSELPTGYHDNPLYRKVMPPQNVWINLAAAYLPPGVQAVHPRRIGSSGQRARPTAYLGRDHRRQLSRLDHLRHTNHARRDRLGRRSRSRTPP